MARLGEEQPFAEYFEALDAILGHRPATEPHVQCFQLSLAIFCITKAVASMHVKIP